jgi:hypothetical protein
MRIDVDDERNSTLWLLRRTRRMTRAALEPLDPAAVVHDDEQAWRVRDVLGHLGVWNGEAARSLEAHAAGGEYTCIATSGLYDIYNERAAAERRAWPMADVWAEYEATHDRLEAAIATMPPDRWDTPIQYPWTEQGSVVGLVVLMTEHETSDHCEPLLARLGDA